MDRIRPIRHNLTFVFAGFINLVMGGMLGCWTPHLLLVKLVTRVELSATNVIGLSKVSVRNGQSFHTTFCRLTNQKILKNLLEILPII